MSIPKEIVAQLNALPIEEVARRLGMEVGRHKALCFMHDDHHPSLAFNVRKNMFYCFVCQKGGGSIRLVQDHQGWSFLEACAWLGAEFGIWWPGEGVETNFESRAKGCEHLDLLVKSSESISNFEFQKTVISHSKLEEPEVALDTEIGERLMEYATLSRAARGFLFEERHYSPKVVMDLHIGSLVDAQRMASKLIKTFGKERCEHSGFFYQWNGRLHLCYKAPCLLFPYYDLEGRLLSIQSRYLGEFDDQTTRFVFPRGVRQRLFNMPVLKGLRPDEPLYVSEGVTDCLALLSDGKKAVAFPSSSICHPEDVRLLAHKFLFMYPDRDAAGESLYTRLNQALEPTGTALHRLDLPEGCKDYSEYYSSLLSGTPASTL